MRSTEARLIRGSFDVATGKVFRDHSKYIAVNVAQAAANDCRKPCGVYLDSFGFVATRLDGDHRPTRTDVHLVHTADPQ